MVLKNQTVRWSSPVLFNDPFDVPREMSFGLTPDDIFAALGRRVADLIEHPPDDTSGLEPKLRLIVDTARRGLPANLKDELLAELREVATSHRPTSDSMDGLRALWRNLIPDLRILCLTDSPSHIAMWFHYADQYRGAVLEFRCDDELDSPWLSARPVEYPTAKPAVYTAEGWAALLTMPQISAIRTILDVSTYTKAPDWSYEREWRITSMKRATDTGPFTDYNFHPEELGAVYLGPMMSDDNREALALLAAQYPSVLLWKVTIGMSRELELSRG